MRKNLAQEKKTVKVHLIKVVEVQSAEDWEQLSQRTGNQLKPDLTALINGFEPTVRPPTGKKVKVIQQRNYSQR